MEMTHFDDTVACVATKTDQPVSEVAFACKFVAAESRTAVSAGAGCTFAASTCSYLAPGLNDGCYHNFARNASIGVGSRSSPRRIH